MIPESASSFARRRPVPLRAAARLPHWLQAHSLRSLAKRLRKTQLPSRARGPSSNLPQRQPQRPILLLAHLARRLERAKSLRGRSRPRRGAGTDSVLATASPTLTAAATAGATTSTIGTGA